HAHGKRFIHRDVKPANLLVAREDGREVVRLADFGLARVYQVSQLSGLTGTGQVGGTPGFMAPEQVTDYRNATPLADQYAAAATPAGAPGNSVRIPHELSSNPWKHTKPG